MSLPTRQQLIADKRWRNAVVDTEHGPILLAAPSHAGSLRIHAAATADSASYIPQLLVECCVEQDGRPTFADFAAALAGTENLSSAAMRKIVEVATQLLRPSKDKEDDSGNSGAGPSAGSPSASVSP